MILLLLGTLLSSSIAIPRPTLAARAAHLSEAQVVTAPQAATPTITAWSPTCSRPVQHTDACYIDWANLTVSAVSSAYVVTMTVAIDHRTRVHASGFFQTSMTLPPDLFAPGFKVACGAPGESGIPNMGATHSYTIRVRDTTQADAVATGSVICPADIVPVTHVDLTGPELGPVNITHTFTASIAPISATVPISYLWQSTGSSDINTTAGVSATQEYTWQETGTKFITVTASNGDGTVTATHTIDIAQPVTGAVLSGPAFGATGATQPFTATASPVSATLPIRYTLRGVELPPVQQTGGLTKSNKLTWDMAGTKAVTVTVANRVGSANASATIHIEDAIAGLTAQNNSPVAPGDTTQLEANISSGTDVDYAWTFGDGGTATTRVAAHVYGETGTYTATVTASNDIGSQHASTIVIVSDKMQSIFLPLVEDH